MKIFLMETKQKLSTNTTNTENQKSFTVRKLVEDRITVLVPTK